MHEQLSDIHEVRKNLHVFQLSIKEKKVNIMKIIWILYLDTWSSWNGQQ